MSRGHVLRQTGFFKREVAQALGLKTLGLQCGLQLVLEFLLALVLMTEFGLVLLAQAVLLRQHGLHFLIGLNVVGRHGPVRQHGQLPAVLCQGFQGVLWQRQFDPRVVAMQLEPGRVGRAPGR